MADTARGTHSTAGVYTREIEIGAEVKSLGITTLGLVGETQIGPAFEPILVSDWASFKALFGGYNATKFKGSQYPKYEAPYIAKSYLEQSQQLMVVRVLGLSGYNAGPAWLVVDNTGKVIAVLRSRGVYEKYHKYVPTLANDCKCGGSVYDHLRYSIGEWDDEAYDCSLPVSYNMDALHIGPFVSLEDAGNECEGYTINGVPVSMAVNSNNYGLFTLYGTTDEGHYLKKSEVASQLGFIPDIEALCDEGGQYIVDKDGNKIVTYYGADGFVTFTTPADGTQYVRGEKDKDGNTFIAQTPSDSNIWANGVKKTVGYFKYGVSLNPADKNYILKVLGSKADDNSSAPVFCESLYDVSLLNGIHAGITTAISNELVGYNVYRTYDYCGLKSVADFIPLAEEALTKRYVGTRYLIDENTPVNVHPYNYNTTKPYAVEPVLAQDGNITAYTLIIKDGYAEGAVEPTEEAFTFKLCTTTGDYEGLFICKVDECEGPSGTTIAQNVNFPSGTTLFVDTLTNTVAVKGSDLIGQAVTVRQYTDASAKRHYFYTYNTQGSIYGASIDTKTGEYKNNVITLLDRLNYIEKLGTVTQDTNNNIYKSGLIKVNTDGYYYRVIEKDGEKSVVRVTIDVNDYKSAYRFASTPWIVSNAKGDRTHIDLHKLFRFHTITDGDSANGMFKVSIKDIRPDEGTFTVQIRDWNDTDANPVVLEQYSKCNLEVGSSNYIAFKIGSYDGVYEGKSKYVTVEVNEDDVTRMSSPCGFVGYPINFYNGYQAVGEYEDNAKAPTIPYNTQFYNELKPKKQYFGCSDLSGIDVDVFTFKGDKYYNENDPVLLSNGFHLDCRINPDSYTDEYDNVVITVDGETGYTFTTIDPQTRTNEATSAPIIATEQDMEETIYHDVNLRKFTVMFYGGFDGWDVYRDQRTNTDEFTRANYKGQVSSVNDEGVNFKGVQNAESLGLTGASITSDYYAYLAGIRQFANPNRNTINILATAGIDYVNQTLLVKDTIEMVEEERQDTLYVVNTPDKPSGANDYEDEMYTAEEAVENLLDTNISTTYACTYYPWVKYLDTTNNQYIYLPPTKDVVRNMAMIDNKIYSWFAPAGYDRGPVDCTKVHKITKIGDTDTLYENYINPIVNFANDGVKVWGQKTMYTATDDETAPLTRVAVRRLLLAIRYRLVKAVRPLIFDPNDDAEADKADSIIRPIMSDIKSKRGVYDYKIKYDTSLEARERLELPVKVFIKPTKQMEYVPIDFVITPQSMDFEDVTY